jgi:hypothetical protein
VKIVGSKDRRKCMFELKLDNMMATTTIEEEVGQVSFIEKL